MTENILVRATLITLLISALGTSSFGSELDLSATGRSDGGNIKVEGFATGMQGYAAFGDNGGNRGFSPFLAGGALVKLSQNGFAVGYHAKIEDKTQVAKLQLGLFRTENGGSSFRTFTAIAGKLFTSKNDIDATFLGGSFDEQVTTALLTVRASVACARLLNLRSEGTSLTDASGSYTDANMSAKIYLKDMKSLYVGADVGAEVIEYNGRENNNGVQDVVFNPKLGVIVGISIPGT